MKAFLMYPDRDFDADGELPAGADALIQDLGLTGIFAAMAGPDEFLLDVARHGVLASVLEPDEIRYRQGVLADCRRHGPVVGELYELAVETLRREREHWRSMLSYPSGILDRAVNVMNLYVEMLGRLRGLAEEHGGEFRSDAFRRFFKMLIDELDDDYFAEVDEHLHQLKFHHGVLISARLGRGNRGLNYVLRKPFRRGWLERLAGSRAESHTLRIAERDEAGLRALGDLRDRGLNLAANALAQATDHILAFFTMLRREIGFYIGCLNLERRLDERGAAVCVPEPDPTGRATLRATGLRDPGLCLRSDEPVVGNEIDADGSSLIMVTGANQGGKSTFLRSVGLAQLMMQAGMAVAAEAFAADVGRGVFTHYKREEDETMRSGKFDEELSRMSEIADRLQAGAVVLFNESFAATNEREGSEIASQIIRALREGHVKVVFVTHMFTLADGLYRAGGDATFLRAERRDDGQRTFRLVPGAPLPTSYGEDLYRRIFGAEQAREPAAVSARNDDAGDDGTI